MGDIGDTEWVSLDGYAQGLAVRYAKHDEFKRLEFIDAAIDRVREDPGTPEENRETVRKEIYNAYRRDHRAKKKSGVLVVRIGPKAVNTFGFHPYRTPNDTAADLPDFDDIDPLMPISLFDLSLDGFVRDITERFGEKRARILWFLAQGLTQKETAERMGITDRYVRKVLKSEEVQAWKEKRYGKKRY